MWVKQRYRDISPVTLQVVGGAVNSSLYCGEVEGVSGGAGLVESFLVELYRCKLCQFTCGLKAAISSHLLLRHRPPTLTYLGRGDRAGGAETGLQLDLNGEPKQSDEDEDFLLYNMLDDISPPTCDISGEGGLQVAHTCEVSTLFEEDEEEVDSSVCPSDPPSSQEEMAQSAHLMTLGLCRISSVRAPPPPPSSSAHPQDCGASIRMKASPLGLPCPLCPLTLPSRRLLDVHVRSHRAAGGFGCVRCRQMADSWEELEPHWRRHCSRRRKKRGREQEQKKKTVAVCRRTLRKGTMKTERWNNHLIGCTEGKEVELPDSLTSRLQTGSQQNVTKNTKNRKKKNTSGKETTGFTCSLCHRKFSSKLTLRRHLGVHGGEKPFTCPHCTYSSRLKASLLQHLRTHTGEKPYRCAECPYASIDRSSLLRHSRTHSQVKPYRCKLCDYSSIQKRSLDLHARRHHTGEMFTCQRCEYSSPDRQLLLRHVRRHHTHSQDATL